MRGLLAPALAFVLLGCGANSGPVGRAPSPSTPALPRPPTEVASPTSPPPSSPPPTTSATVAPAEPVAAPREVPPLPGFDRATRTRAALGVNVHRLRDYTGDWPFVDVFKSSRFWASGTVAAWQDDRRLALDDDGWVKRLEPNQVARALFFWADGSRHPTGAYTVLYEGKGAFTYRNAERKDARPGREVIWVSKGSGGFALELVSTDPADPIRNVRVLLPGGSCRDDERTSCTSNAACGAKGTCQQFEATYRERPYHPDFLRQLAPFSTVRFMEWSRINEPPLVKTWAERGKPSHATWTARGVPYEVQLDLTRRLDADVWLCLPHAADDDFVHQLGQLLAKQLGPTQRAYVEVSNEVWNNDFPQAKYFEEQGAQAGIDGSGFDKRLRAYSRRSRQVFEILGKELGDPKRLVRVMAAQSGNAYVAKAELTFEDAFRSVDALAIAPYFGAYLGQAQARDQVKRATLDQAFGELEQRAFATALGEIQEHKKIADRASIALVAYEGGQHLVGVGPVSQDADLNARFLAVNRDRRMGALYTRYLETWRKEGGGLMMLFALTYAPTRYGAWGLLESTADTRERAPKYDAALRFIESAGR